MNVFVNLKGGLGNQLFQISTLLAYCWENNYNPIIIPIKNSPSVFENRKTYWKDYLRKLKIYFIKKTIDKYYIYKDPCYNYTKIPKINNNNNINILCLDGFFCSYKYFNKYILKLREFYIPPDSDIINLKKKYKHIFDENNYNISLHIRRGDYLKLQHHHIVLDMNYYDNALKYILEKTKQKKNRIFNIFSEDITWCKKNFRKYSDIKFNYFESEKDYNEIYMMSFCKSFVVANSTFSWWGCYLAKNRDYIVFPKKWFVKNRNYKDLYFSDIKLF